MDFDPLTAHRLHASQWDVWNHGVAERILTIREAGVRPEVLVWLQDNCRGWFWLNPPNFFFEDYRELVMFAMRWG